MSTFDNTNRGAIFKNTNKKEDKHPDYRGTINVDGIEKEISLWVKTSQKGEQFFSVSISEPYKKPEGNEPKKEDSLPF
jgi:uncharacterized protein (DUF736 family)